MYCYLKSITIPVNYGLTDRLGGKDPLVFHFGVGRHASFPQKPVVKAKKCVFDSVKVPSETIKTSPFSKLSRNLNLIKSKVDNFLKFLQPSQNA